MSAISLKSITGITSITTPTGVDNQLTLHTNDTTQRVKVTQSGIEVVGVATFQDIDVDGHTNLDNVSIAGVTTFASNAFLGDDDNLYLGASNDLRIYHAAGAASHINAVGLVNIDGTTGVRLEYNNANRVHCTSTGVTIGGDLDVDAHTNLDNVSVAGVVTATTFVGALTGEASQVNIGNGANNRIITASGTNTLDCAGNFTFGGNVMELGAAGAEGGALYINGGTINNPGGRDAKLYIDDQTDNDWAMYVYKPSNNYGIQMAMSDSASHAFYIVGAGAERFRISGSGEIAKCGSIYPRAADTFDIGDIGTSKWRKIYAQSLHSSDATKPSLSLYTGSTLRADLAATSGITSIRSYANSPFTINIGGSGETEAFRIDSGGRLLVGRTSVSNSDSTMEIQGSTDTYLRIASGNTGGSAGVVFGSSDDHSTGGIYYANSDDSLRLAGYNNTERLRITSDGKVGINQTDIDTDLHIATAGSSEQDGTLKIGGSENSLGLLLAYDQASYTVSKITANPTYTNGNALLKICVDGDGNPDQLVLSGAGKIGINIADNTGADLQVRTGSNGAGVFRLGGSNSNAIGMDATYSNSGATSTEFKQNYRSTNAGALMKFDSGYFTFHTGTGGDTRLKISKHGQLLHGNSSEDQGWAVFFNAPGSGADAGTAGADGGGDQGVNIRTDMGPTHLDLTGVDNFTLKLANQAYAGAGVADPNGTVSKILFNTVTYNGWNSYGAIALQSQGASSSRGEMVFMLNNGTSSMNEKLRITANQMNTANGLGMNLYGQDVNHTNDAVLYAHKTGNADWCIQAAAPGNDYGIYSRVGNGAAYALGVYDSNNSTWRFRVRGDGVVFASNTTIQSISDVRLKENIVDANSQWDDIKGLRFRNFNWKSDSGYDDGKTMLGLIAQEVEPISPNLVDLDAQTKEDIENGVPDPEYKSVKYSIVWMKAVKALQEAQARIEQLEAKVAALESS